MKKTPIAASLIALTLAEGIHYQEPDALPPDEHIDQNENRLPIRGGRVTAWLTSTSSVASQVSIADLAAIFRNLK